MPTILVSKQTIIGAANFSCDSSSYQLPCTLISNGLAGAEVIDLQVSDDGITYAPAYDQAGAVIQLTATRNTISITSPGKYRVVKSVTVAAVGVGISTAASA